VAKKNSTFREYLEALLIALVFLGFTNTFLVKTFYIPSASMEDTLLIGDHLFVNRFIYGQPPVGPLAGLLPHRDIAQGDVAIFRSPERPRVDMVKRCIGRPGDTLRIVDKDLYLDDMWVDDAAYTVHRDARVYANRPDVPPAARVRDNFGPYTVEGGGYFCMGDNRDQSYDSRYWGLVPKHYVKGRALLIYWSYAGETPDGEWHGWGTRLVQIFRTAVGFFTHTRWSRTFHLIR
jgi:signal peptidase I